MRFTPLRLLRLEHILAQTANRANPILGDIFPLSAGSDSAIGVANSRVINIATGANVLFQDFILLSHKYYAQLLLEISVQQTLESLTVSCLVAATLLLFYASGNVQKPLESLFKPHL